MHKPWMKNLKTYRFSRDGLMTQETARDQREADRRQAKKDWSDYSQALGFKGVEGRQLIIKHEEMLRKAGSP